jgi:serine/threonine-protein kinase
MSFFCIHCKSEIDPKYKACPFCGEAITDFLRKHLEAPIDGKYQILSRLGVGGMGEVYKALHIHLNSIRVIKLMRTAISGDRGSHERFLREARLATRIQHPNVATLFDFSSLDEGTHYMVWEYIEGTNLHELISERGPLSERYAAKLSIEALLGLDAIHRAGIVHRDISPENLMITRDDEGEERVKIIDLGIAKSSAADDDRTKTGIFVGKWKYCSPEHLGMLTAGERIDGRADLYSFGIVMYEMLAGVPPFQADTPHAFLMMHAHERPRPLREVNPGVVASPEFERVIFRMLEKDRSIRFQSARETVAELERIMPSLSDVPGEPPPVPLSAEVTSESTRDVRVTATSTVISVAQDAVTMVTEPPLDRTIDRVTIPADAPSPRTATRRPIAIGVAAALVLVAIIAAWMMRPRDETPVAAEPIAASVITVKPGRLAINAFPWAEIRNVRNAANGEAVTLEPSLVTPAPLELEPGRYEVTLFNPAFENPVVKTVTIEAGRDATLNVHFSDPAVAALPNFGAAR